MSLSPVFKQQVEEKVDAFCKNRVPEHALHKVNLSYKIRGNNVTIYENRAPWHASMKEWTSMPIAQLRYNDKTTKWILYYADRNDRWNECDEIEPNKNIDVLINEIDEDPTGVFWG